MRIIFKIAKAELRTLFYSPIAWVIAVAFSLVCGVQFGNPLEEMAATQQFKIDNEANFTGFGFSLTQQLFAGSYGFLLSNLYLFIPLLTMGLISREVHAGTIRLLYSSPVKPRTIIFGKYVGLMLYNAILMVPIALLMAAGYFAIVSPDYKVFFSALLGIYLLTGTYMAIGLFISSLTGYQIVAALLTFLVFAILNNISGVWQEYDFFRDLTWFLNIAGRVESLLVGLIKSSDLCYFILVMFLFVWFTLIKVKSRTESKRWYVYFARYVAAFVVVLLLGYITSRPGYVAYLDVTRNQTNTIHPEVQKVIRELKGEPLKVTLYTNITGDASNSGYPAARNAYLWHVWGQYQRFHPDIDFRFVYYYDLPEKDSTFKKMYPTMTLDEVAEKVMELNNLPKSIIKKPAEIRSVIDLEPEGKRLVMELEYKGKKTFLRTYNDMLLWPQQTQVAGALARLARDTTPMILFATGHYERSPYRTGERDYTAHTLYKLSRGALLNQGVNVDTINLLQQDIPANTAMLVIADPRSAYTEEEQAKVRAYLEAGGNAIFYGDPGKQQMLNPMLQSIGVQLDDGIMVAPNPHEMAHIVSSGMTDAAGHLALEPTLYLYQRKEITALRFPFSGASHMRYDSINGFTVKPLFELRGADTIWIERGVYVADSAAPVFAESESDLKLNKYVMGVQLSRTIGGKEQRIIVTSDADFMSALRHSGLHLGNACYSWVMNNAYPVYTNMPLPVDRKLTINRDQAGNLWILFVYIIPAIIMITGSILLIRRKRK